MTVNCQHYTPADEEGHLICMVGASPAGSSIRLCRYCPMFLSLDGEPLHINGVRTATPQRKRNKPASCRHIGGIVEKVSCPTCRGNVQVHVFTCQVHGVATIAKAVGDRACCASCTDYEPILP